MFLLVGTWKHAMFRCIWKFSHNEGNNNEAVSNNDCYASESILAYAKNSVWKFKEIFHRVPYPDVFSYCWIGMATQKMSPNF